MLIRPYFKFAVANLYIIPSSKATKAQKAKKGKEREVGSSSAQDNQTLTLDELNSGSEASTVETTRSTGRVTANSQRAGLDPGIPTVYREAASRVERAAEKARQSLSSYGNSLNEVQGIATALQKSLRAKTKKGRKSKRVQKMDASILDPEITANVEAMPSGQAFPPSYAKNRPHYEKSQILDYLIQCEEVMAINGVTTDRVKKMILVYYLSYTEKQVWTQMSKYRTGTYQEFKDQILSFHPQALKQAKGDLARLKIVCAPYKDLQRKDYDALIEFHLLFRNKAKKLGSLVSNRELAETYLTALHESFREQVLDAIARDNEGDKDCLLVRGDTPLSWEKYLDKAEVLANARKQFTEDFNFDKGGGSVLPKPFSFASPSGAALRASEAPRSHEPASVPAKQEVDEDRLLQRFHSMLNEKFNEYEDRNERFMSDMRNTKDKMEIMLKNPHNFMLNQQNRPSRPIPNPSQRQPVCFYCNQPGHYMGTCVAREAHIKAGKVQQRHDGLYTADGKRLFQNEHESMREYVDKYVAGAVQNVQNVYEDEYSRHQYNYNAYEPEPVTREDIRQLQAAIEGLSHKASSLRTPLPSQNQQFVQNQEDSSLNQLKREQERMSRVMSQLVDSLEDLKGRGQSQFVTTRTTGASEEDFQDD